MGVEVQIVEGSAVQSATDHTIELAFTVRQAVACTVDALKLLVAVVDIFALHRRSPIQFSGIEESAFCVFRIDDVGIQKVAAVILEGTHATHQ